MKKQLSIIALVVALLLSMMAGCASSKPAESAAPAPESQAPASTAPSAPTEEAEKPLNWPTKTITIIVQNKAGGSNDLLARAVAPIMSEKLGVPVVVENVVGGDGVIALTKVYNAPADGYTLVSWSPPGEYTSYMEGLLEFNPVEAFTPLGASNQDPNAIAVRADSPYQTFEELDAAIKSASVPMTVGVVGAGGANAVAVMKLCEAMDWDLTMVPNDSGADLTAAVLGGHLDIGTRNGGFYDLHPEELRILAFAADERLEQYPDIPTVEELCGKPVYASATRGLCVRSDTDPEIIKILRDTYYEAITSPEIADNQYEQLGAMYRAVSGEEMEEIQNNLVADMESMRDVLFAE